MHGAICILIDRRCPSLLKSATKLATSVTMDFHIGTSEGHVGLLDQRRIARRIALEELRGYLWRAGIDRITLLLHRFQHVRAGKCLGEHRVERLYLGRRQPCRPPTANQPSIA